LGNPAAQVVKTFTAGNQQGADIAFRPNLSGANNVLDDNFCLTYIAGAGRATAPCPSLRTEGFGEAAIRETVPPKGRNESASAVASLVANPLRRQLQTGIVLASLTLVPLFICIALGKDRK
jgi:hypothetical protein